jgi:hypothetical protein
MLAKPHIRNFSILASIILLLSICSNAFSQVGIGVELPSNGLLLEVDDVEGETGVMLARVSIDDLSTITPLPVATRTGTLVFNTNSATGIGYFFWDGAAWQRYTSYVGETAKFVNPASSAGPTGPNLTTAAYTGVQLVDPVNVIFNDNPTLYVPNNNTGITVNQTGRYHVTVILSMTATFTGDNLGELDVSLFIDNVAFGPLLRTTEMNVVNSIPDNGSVTFTQTVEIAAGETISVKTRRAQTTSNAVVRLRSTGSSSIFIERLL